jgi:hypothetical protein
MELLADLRPPGGGAIAAGRSKSIRSTSIQGTYSGR